MILEGCTLRSIDRAAYDGSQARCAAVAQRIEGVPCRICSALCSVIARPTLRSFWPGHPAGTSPAPPLLPPLHLAACAHNLATCAGLAALLEFYRHNYFLPTTDGSDPATPQSIVVSDPSEYFVAQAVVTASELILSTEW